MIPLPTAAPYLGAAAAAEKQYTNLETLKIQCACGLTDAQYQATGPNAVLPAIYPRMLDEGRTTAKVRAVLEDAFRPAANVRAMHRVHITVTDDMAKDFKELNFGYNMDLSYETCHRGVSIFGMVGVSMAMHSQRSRAAERLSRATHITLADVTSQDSRPDKIPSDYSGLADVLRRYHYFLMETTGTESDHGIQVENIASELIASPFLFERVSRRQIASLMWQVFMDARRFFSTGPDAHGRVPQSRLRNVHSDLMQGNIQEHVNVPYDKLLGSSRGTTARR